MQVIPIYVVNAFTHEQFGGNPAAVCVLEKWLSNDVLQAMAAQHNLSETAFLVISPDDDSDYDIRWFTPTHEVDLCGHATLAASSVVFDTLNFTNKVIRFQSRVGVLTVEKSADNKMHMNFPKATYNETRVVGTFHSAFGKSPLQAFSCPTFSGDAEDLLLVFENEAQVNDAEINFKAMRTLKYRIIIITSLSAEDDVDFVCRVFAPSIGIDEDPVTGSAFTVLAPFWSAQHAVENTTDNNTATTVQTAFFAKQTSKRGGHVWCSLVNHQVQVSGFTKLYSKGELYL